MTTDAIRDDVTFRLATLADAEAITDNQIASRLPVYRGRLPDGYVDRLSREARIRQWQDRLSDDDPHRVVWVAEHAGRIVGVCYASGAYPHPTEDSGHIQSLYIHPDMKGHGVGRRLLTMTLDSMARLGLPTATLHVYSSNVEARGFYEHLGWRPIGEVQLAEWAGEPILAWRMVISLTSTTGG